MSYVPHFHRVRGSYRILVSVVVFGCAGEFGMNGDPIVSATTSDSNGKRTIMRYIGIATRAGVVAAVILGLVALVEPTAVQARGGFGGGGFGWGGRGYGAVWSGGFYPGYYGWGYSGYPYAYYGWGYGGYPYAYYGWGYGGYPYAYYRYAYPYSTYPYYGY